MITLYEQRVDASKFKPPNLTKQQILQPQYSKGVVPPLYTPTIENGPCHSIFLPDNCLRFPFDEYTIEKRERREDTNLTNPHHTTITPPTAQNIPSKHVIFCELYSQRRVHITQQQHRQQLRTYLRKRVIFCELYS